MSGKLSEEVQLLASVREAVGLERKEPDRQHKIDVAQTVLDQLVQGYARRKQELETEITPGAPPREEEVARVERERREQEEAFEEHAQVRAAERD